MLAHSHATPPIQRVPTHPTSRSVCGGPRGHSICLPKMATATAAVTIMRLAQVHSPQATVSQRFAVRRASRALTARRTSRARCWLSRSMAAAPRRRSGLPRPARTEWLAREVRHCEPGMPASRARKPKSALTCRVWNQPVAGTQDTRRARLLRRRHLTSCAWPTGQAPLRATRARRMFRDGVTSRRAVAPSAPRRVKIFFRGCSPA